MNQIINALKAVSWVLCITVLTKLTESPVCTRTDNSVTIESISLSTAVQLESFYNWTSNYSGRETNEISQQNPSIERTINRTNSIDVVRRGSVLVQISLHYFVKLRLTKLESPPKEKAYIDSEIYFTLVQGLKLLSSCCGLLKFRQQFRKPR